MSAMAPDPYIPGTSEVPSIGPRSPRERKSPPLSELQPHRERHLNVDPARYTSVEEMRREQELLWPKVWIHAGLVSDLPSVGSWFRFNTGSESFVIARSGEAEFSAFYNVCQHRGNQIVHEDFGHGRGFTCAYHSWVYDLQGKIKRVTDREYFNPKALCGNLDIPKVRCEVWAGQIFINMDDNAAPLLEYLDELTDFLEPYHMENMHVVHDVVIELECNWKVVMDAFSEAYHLHQTHPQVLPMMDDMKVQIDFYKGGHGRIITALGLPSSRASGEDTLNPGLEFLLEDSGVDPKSFTGSAQDVRRACQLGKRKPDNIYGLDYSEYSDNQLSDSWIIDVFPNMQWTLHPEGVLIMRFSPHRTDLGKCSYHIMVIIPKMKEGKRPPFYMGVPPEADISGTTRASRTYLKSDNPNLKEIIGELIWQDVCNMERCQRGMESRGFNAIRLSEHEQRIQHQFSEIDRYLYPHVVASDSA